MPSWHATAQPNLQTPADLVEAILSIPDEKLDYTKAKLAFDQIVAPDLDEMKVRRELDAMTLSVRKLLPVKARSHELLQTVQKVIYQPGPWNNNRPFAYDMSDPLGRNLNNKLLSTYLDTRLGNCVSMPVLQLIIADRLGANVHLSTAPLHVFVRYTDSQGRSLNIESTSGGHPARTSWYRQKSVITDRAIESGIYLRTLTKRESVALMASTVVEWLMHEKRYEDAIAVTDVILNHYPLDVHTLLKRATAQGYLLNSEFVEKYPSPKEIPASLRPRYMYLASENAKAFAKAEALGWTPVE